MSGAQGSHANPVASAQFEEHLRTAPWSQTRVDRVVEDVMRERVRQHERWGNQSNHSNLTWLAILGEEVGEANQAQLHNVFGGRAAGTLRDELVQVAAVALAFIEAIDQRGQEGW